MQVKFYNNVLHFDKVMTLFKSFNLLTINTRQYVKSAVFYTYGRIFFKLQTHFTRVPTLSRTLVGYESHLAIVLVHFDL